MLQSSNQNCNALQSIIGVFLKSCNAPETVCEFLAHAGLLLSMSSINNAVTNLSREAGTKICELKKSLLTSYAYDNLDINLKHSVPTLGNSWETLIHLASGTMLLLHEVALDDLNCSNQLWEKSHLNPNIPQNTVQKVDIVDLMEIHPEQDHLSGLL